MPDATAGPSDLLAGTNLLSRRHSRRHMPVREMTGLDAAVDAAATLHVRRRGGDSRVERVHAMRQPRRRPGLGRCVVDVDVDPEVVAGETVVIGPAWVDERPPDRMLHRPRRNRPTPRKRVVGVRETRRQRTRHTTVHRPVRRRLRRNPGRGSAPAVEDDEEHTADHEHDRDDKRQRIPSRPLSARPAHTVIIATAARPRIRGATDSRMRLSTYIRRAMSPNQLVLTRRYSFTSRAGACGHPVVLLRARLVSRARSSSNSRGVNTGGSAPGRPVTCASPLTRKRRH